MDKFLDGWFEKKKKENFQNNIVEFSDFLCLPDHNVTIKSDR